MIRQLEFVLFFVYICSSAAFDCDVYKAPCQCSAAALGTECLWCPTDSSCKRRDQFRRSIVCDAPIAEIQTSIGTCQSPASAAVVSQNLPAYFNGKETTLLTDGTDAGHDISGSKTEVFVQLRSFFHASKVAVRFRVNSESVAGRNALLMKVKEYGMRTKIATRPPLGFDTGGSQVETCDETPTTLEGSVLVDCLLSIPTDHELDGVGVTIQGELPMNEDSGTIQVTLSEVSVSMPEHTRVEGSWARISNWESCSNTCGSGNQTRYRTCTNPRPEYGGAWCLGPDTFQRECKDTTGCPTDWGVVFTIGWWQFGLISFAVIQKIREAVAAKRNKDSGVYAQKLVEDVFTDSDALTDEAWYQHQEATARQQEQTLTL